MSKPRGSAVSSEEDVKSDLLYTQTIGQIELELQRAAAPGGRFSQQPDDETTRHLRQAYTELIGELKTNKREILTSDTRLTDLLGRADELHSAIKTTCDATLDSRFIAVSAEIGAEKIGRMSTAAVEFTLDNFVGLTRSALFRPAGANWSVLGRLASHHWQGVCTPEFFLGPIAVVPKERVARPRNPRARREAAPLTEAVPMDEETIREHAAMTSETTRNVMLVFEKLVQVSPVPFYKFVLHPTFFSRSVENLFYVSFLVSDDRAAVSADPATGDLILEAVTTSEDEGDGESRAQKHQRVFGLTMGQWRELRQKYSIQRPLI